MISYLVCATHRSGSNLLCQSLWHTDLCGFPQEFFSPTRAAAISAEYGLGADPEVDYPAYVAELVATRQSENEVFGAKIMWAHLAPFLESVGGEGELPAGTLSRVFPDLRYLWMRRDDKLRQAISMWKAKQTRIYNSLQEGERTEADAPEFDYEQIRKTLQRFEREDAEWAGFFAEHAIEPIEVHYEAFAEDHRAGTGSILAELGIELPENFQPKPLTYRKLADSTNEQWRERYLEMEAAGAP